MNTTASRFVRLLIVATCMTHVLASAQPAMEVASTVALLEGPTVDEAGQVYVSDVRSNRILKLDAEGRLSVFRTSSNGSVGLLIDSEGRLIACEGGSDAPDGVGERRPARITRTTLKTGAIEVLADHFEGRPFSQPNDLAMDSKGRLYFTDMRGAAVYRVDGPGRIARILAAPDVGHPNGIQVSPDDRTLYVVESGTGKNDRREIRAFELRADGSLGASRQLYDFYPGRSADGLSIDVEGNIYASAGISRLRNTSETLATPTGVYVISPAGRLLEFLPVPQDVITNNTFGGPDRKTLYVTAGPTLYKVRRSIAGLHR